MYRFASSYLSGVNDVNFDRLSETYLLRRNSCVKAGTEMDAADAGYVFVEIVAPGLSADFPVDAKQELSNQMTGILAALLVAPIQGLSVGRVAAGSMELLIRSTEEAWATLHENPQLLRLLADAYTIAMSEMEFAGDFSGVLQAAFNGASSASAQPLSAQSRAFWHQPGLLSYGNVTIKSVISSTREASTCAALCSNDPDCSTFAFSFLERLCFLLSNAELTMCDPEVSTTCSEKNNELLTQVSVISRCRYCVFYYEDVESLYCASSADRCSALREYHQCMHKSGCGESEKDYQV